MPVVKKILDRLLRHAPVPAPLPEPDAEMALGALLVRMAMSDRNYDAKEIGEIDKILGLSFGLGPIEAAKMRATCERLEKAAPGTGAFAKLIRTGTAHAPRLDMMTALWMVALADGEKSGEEEALLRQLQNALGLSDLDYKAARKRAEAAQTSKG